MLIFLAGEACGTLDSANLQIDLFRKTYYENNEARRAGEIDEM